MAKQLELDFEGVPELLTPGEIYDRASKGLLSQIKEGRYLERKSSRVQGKTLGEYFSMWANTSPEGGLIVVGIEDDGEFVGCSGLDQKSLNKLESAGRIYCPDARYDTKLVPFEEEGGSEDYLLLIRVFYRSDRVVKTVSNSAYIRRGEDKFELSADEIRELEIDKGQIDFELEHSGYSYPDDFDLDLVRLYVKKYRESRGLTNGNSDVEILSMRHLGQIINGTFVPNNACALLFAKDPTRRFPGCKIRFMRFEGEQEGTGHKLNLVKDLFVEGPIPRQIMEIDQILSSQLRDFSRLGPDSKFFTAPEYPRPAWYEAVVNAVVHRSYSLRNMNIFIRMFDDRLEIESPGPFPPLVTPSNIYDTHQPRNPYLMDAMFYLDFCKMNREGTRRMKEAMEDVGLETPIFEQQEKGTHVTVTLRNSIKQRRVWVDADVSGIVGAAVASSLQQEELRIINFLAENQEISVSDVMRLTSKSWPASKKLLVKLRERGIVFQKVREHLDRDPQARWYLNVGSDR